MFLSNSTAAIVGGVSLGAVAVKRVFDGDSVAFPGFSQDELIQFWLPMVGAILLLAPGIVPISGRNKRLVGAGIALFVGGRALLDGQTELTVDNAIKAHLPVIAGVALVA